LHRSPFVSVALDFLAVVRESNTVFGVDCLRRSTQKIKTYF
jgi:hypothetical protein